jgi:hypothetical protein
MNSKAFFFLFFCACLPSLQVIAQDEDIFGISKKARNPKSNSSIGNAFRTVREQFSFQLSTGAAQYSMGTKFYRGDGQVYPITQYQNHEFGYDPLPDTLALSSRQWIFPTVEASLRLNLFNILRWRLWLGKRSPQSF